jgi:hypothetical protein
VHQGDPLSPLFFTLVAAEVATALDGHWNQPGNIRVQQQWYLDDGLLVVHKALAKEVLDVVERAAGVVGLSLNRGKCETLGRCEGLAEVAEATGTVAFGDPALWTYLGCPLMEARDDHPAFQAALARCEKLAEAIAQLECPEAQLALWRQCMGACRIQHLTDTCEARETDGLAAKVAAGMREGLGQILNAPVKDEVWVQATLPVRDGGLGLQNPTTRNADAHLASLARLPVVFREGHEVAYQAKLDAALETVAARRRSTKEEVSLWLDRTMGKGINPIQDAGKMWNHWAKGELVKRADPANRRRLTAVSAPHAMAWTQGPGKARPLSNVEFQAGMHWALGMEVQEGPSMCPCGREADTLGRHYANCQLFDRRTRRHNEWRDTVAALARAAGMAVEVEAAPEGQRTRPGDILIPGWRSGRPLAVDFAITAADQVDAADRIAHTKERKYSEVCWREGWQFVPVVGDSFGAVRGAGGKFLSTLCKRVAEKAEPGQWPLPQTLFWQSVSTCLVRRAAGAIAVAWAQSATPPEAQAGEESREEGQGEGRGGDEPPDEGGGGREGMGVDDEEEEVVVIPVGSAGINRAQPLGPREEEMEVVV